MRYYRERAGMSQRALAKLSEINPAIVSRLETGDRMPSGPHQVLAIARALDLSPADRDNLLSMAGHWPSAILALGPQDETLLEVARVLSTEGIQEEELNRFRAIVHLLAEQLLTGRKQQQQP
jgi:transcriptional regulator with XRE-family HTH domain